MEIAPQITVAIRPELYQAVSKSSYFKPGSTLILKVLELRGDRALIDFGNFRASADMKIPVTLGEELTVRVQESGRQLKLALVSTEQPKLSTHDTSPQIRQSAGEIGHHQIQTELKQILNQFLGSQNAKTISNSIINLFNMLSSHFESFNFEKMMTDVMPRLKSYVENSGFFLEKLLENAILNLKDETDTAHPRQLANHPEVQTILNRDLKANLLILQKTAVDDAMLQKAIDTRSMAILRRAADFLLADIANQQGRAVKQFDSSDPFQVFTYALPMPEEKQAAKLKIYYQKKQQAGSKNGFQVSLLLSMDRLGDIRTDFYLLGKDLTVTFFVKDQCVKKNIQENLHELPELLNPLFNQVLLRVIVSEKKVKDFDHEDIEITSDRRVDLRV